MSAPVRIVLFGAAEPAGHLAPRTVRSLAAAGLGPEDARPAGSSTLGEALASATAPVWLVREGAWRARPGPAVFPPASRTGRPLCALGAVLTAPGSARGDDEARWEEALAGCGGDFDRGGPAPLPPLASVYLEPALASAVGRRLSSGEPLPAALRDAVGETRARVVRYAPLDVYADAGLRVAQVVTSLQQGGAERVALSLAAALPRLGVRTSLIVTGAPTRAPLPAPAGVVDLSRERLDSRDRRVLGALAAFGADVVHAHLLGVDETRRLAESGLPVVVTVHNVRPGWPSGIDGLRRGEATLLVACARAVEWDLRDVGLPVPVRTVWNGVDFDAYPTAPDEARARERARLGFGQEDLVLVAVANPRPQKRLTRLPAVLAATREELSRRGEAREARLVIAGGGTREADREELDRVASAAAALGLARHVYPTGSVEDVAALLAASDVMVSTSAFEGLSLAHIEALAAGLPLVASAVGGTPELGAGNPAVRLVAPDAGPARYAAAIVEVATARPSGGRAAAERDFTLERMARGYARLYPRAIAARRPRRDGGGVLLVTNNFSTGGAQSSARRLLLGLHGQGVGVRAAVLEEAIDDPTPGRRALLAAGIEVAALPAPAVAGAEEAVGRLLDLVDGARPEAVLLWNALASHKVLLAEQLLDVPLFDVSPGEMYYESLARYLARPPAGLPCRTAADYGARLSGVIVKYRAEAEQARRVLGAPVHVIPNGVPLPPLPVGGRPTDPERPVVIGTLARLDPRKKVHELLDAVARADGRLPRHVLRIAGGVEPGCDAYAEELRRSSAGSAVEWVGEVGEPGNFLDGLDVFALVAEPAGCPNASLEAMSAGLPVIATDVGGITEQVVHGVTGHVVPRSDPDALADALVDLAQDPFVRARLGRAGWERVRERFTLERMIADYRRVCLTRGEGSPVAALTAVERL